MADQPPLIPLPFALNTSHRITREISHTLIQFLNNLIYNSTTPRSFETYPEDIYTTPLIREHHDSYLYYIDTGSLLPNLKNIHFLFLSLLKQTPLILLQKTSILIIFIFLSPMYLQLF